MNPQLRDNLLIVFISLVIAAVVWYFASIIPHPVAYNGVGLGDVGVPYVSMLNWLSRRPVYNLQAASGNYTINITANPFTTSLVISPLLLLPLRWIGPFFSSFSAGILAYGILRKGEYWRLLVFLSFPFVSAIFDTQWSPLFAAALYIPALLPIAVAKPQLGLSLVVTGRWSKATIFTAFRLIILSIILYPRWPIDYLIHGSLKEYSGWIPIGISIGVFLLFSILRWRSRRGRLLLAMSVVPQRLWYDQFLVLFIPHNVGEQFILILCSWIAALLSKSLGWIITFSDQDYRAVLLTIIMIYFPALFMLFLNDYSKEPSPLVDWIDQFIKYVKNKLPRRTKQFSD